MTIGDKGRAQLQRVAPEKIKLSVQDTYKDKVTFSQVHALKEQPQASTHNAGTDGAHIQPGHQWHCSVSCIWSPTTDYGRFVAAGSTRMGPGS